MRLTAACGPADDSADGVPGTPDTPVAGTPVAGTRTVLALPRSRAGTVRARLPRPRRRRPRLARVTTARHYAMCPPLEFEYGAAAVAQWEHLRETLLGLGHRVSLVPSRAGLPGMVLASQGATVVDGRVLGARFRTPERRDEGPAYLRWFTDRGYQDRLEPVFPHEGDTDLLPAGRVLLAAAGPRTSPRAHAEAGTFLGRDVVPLELVDPRFPRLAAAVAPLTDDTVAVHPGAFAPVSLAALGAVFREVVEIEEGDAAGGGLEAVCDGGTVILADGTPGLTDVLAHLGFSVVTIDFSAFPVGPRGCVLELRP